MLNVFGRDLIEKVQSAHDSGTLAEILGYVVALPIDIDRKRLDHRTGLACHYFLFLADVRPSTSAFDLLGATATERAATEELLAGLREDRQSPLDYLSYVVTNGLGVVALDEAEHIGTGVEFAVLQAMSDGYVGNAPGRLHGMVIGPPGQGKKLIGMAARALNPTCQEGSASKVSPAGLVGTSFKTATGWTSTPGLLPLASHGVLVVQDAHGWSPAQVKSIGPILQELIEDGEVRDSVAGGRKRVAQTALLLDLNRQAQTVTGGSRGGEAPILGLLPLLSRFDTLIEIPVNPERAWDVGEQMIGRLNTESGGPLEQQPWVRQAQLLVAALRDVHRVIDTSGVTAHLEAAHRSFREQCRNLMETHPTEATAIPVRLSVSMTRLVLASARANDRSYATAEDVDRASKFLASKLSVITNAAVHMPTCPSDKRTVAPDFWASKAGSEVTAAEMAKAHEAEKGIAVSYKTITREFKRIGAQKRAFNRWLLPPATTT